MNTWNTAFPTLLVKLHQLTFDFDNGEGMDFDPFQAFYPADENALWFKSWTGNPLADGAQFRIFGKDGMGGYAALWFTLPEKSLEEQPVVFLGSEGERKVLAVNLDEYLWLLAAGLGPYEASAYPEIERKPNEQFIKFAQENSRVSTLSATDVIAHAETAYPFFSQYIDDLCR